MKKDFNCTCNRCGADFKCEFKVLIADEDRKVKITYLECPECGHKYFSGVSDAEYSHMLDEYRKRQQAIQKAAKSNAKGSVLQSLANKMNNYETRVMIPYYEKLKEEWKDYFEESADAE